MSACPHCDSTHGTPLAEQLVETYEYWEVYRIRNGEKQWSTSRVDGGWTREFSLRTPLDEDPGRVSGARVVHVRVTRRIRSKP